MCVDCVDCSGKELVVATGLKSVEGLAVDWIAKNLYYTDGGNKLIGVVRLRSQSFTERRPLIRGTCAVSTRVRASVSQLCIMSYWGLECFAGARSEGVWGFTHAVRCVCACRAGDAASDRRSSALRRHVCHVCVLAELAMPRAIVVHPRRGVMCVHVCACRVGDAASNRRSPGSRRHVSHVCLLAELAMPRAIVVHPRCDVMCVTCVCLQSWRCRERSSFTRAAASCSGANGRAIRTSALASDAPTSTALTSHTSGTALDDVTCVRYAS